MNQILRINNTILKDITNYYTFFSKKVPGIKKITMLRYRERFEVNTALNYFPAEELKEYELSLLDFFYDFFPKNLSIIDRQATYIIFFSLLWNYKGWRHFKGLPCRGQRTWSNAWSSYKSNLVLRDYKKRSIRKLYGKIGGPEQRICFLCEYINYLWKTQWFCEWMHSRRWIKETLKKKKVVFNLDLYATSKGLLGNLKKDSKGVSKKKKKLLTGHVGFDQGFTKLYLKAKYTVSKKIRKKLRFK